MYNMNKKNTTKNMLDIKPMPSNQKSTDYDYYGFISYKHEFHGCFSEDAKWAAAIDKELRNLHIPTEMVNIEELISEIDDSVDPIFRDTSNLPITHKGELERHLTESLAASKSLILILSEEMLKDQNNLYNKDPKKSQAWIYWEVKTFLACHGYDWSKIIPVYIDSNDYDVNNIQSAIGIEEHFENIVKPWHDYHHDQDWDKERQYFYERAAADVACKIFNLKDKQAFWNIKKKANEAHEMERKKNYLQKLLLSAGIAFVGLVSFVIVGLFLYTKSINEVAQSQLALDSGSRKVAIEYSKAAHRHWRYNKDALKTMWEATDSTRAYMTVDSHISFDGHDSLFVYKERNRYLVIAETKTFSEVERVDVGEVDLAFISPDAGKIAFFDNAHFLKVYNRKTHEREEKGQVWSSSVKWNNASSIMLAGKHLYMDEKDFMLCEKWGDGSITISYSSASFMGTDSLLAVVSNRIDTHMRSPKILVYNLKKEKRCLSSGGWLLPSEVLEMKADLIDGQINENGGVIAFSRDSVYYYHVDNRYGNITSNIQNRDPINAPLQKIVFNQNQTSAFLVDSSLNAFTYYCQGRSPRLAYPYTKNLETKSKSLLPICSVNDDHVLYYLDPSYDINLSDGYNLGLHLPLISPKASITGMQHKNFVSIEVTETSGRSNNYKTYLYYPGDGRMIIPKNVYRVLSSNYVIRAGMDLFIEDDGKSRTVSSSYCLFDVNTGNHIMHLSQIKDKEYGTVYMTDCCYSGNMLAVVFHKKDGSYYLRLYDLIKKEMIYELSYEKTPFALKWMNGNTLVYVNDGRLYQLPTRSDNIFPNIVSTDVNGVYTSDLSPEVYIYNNSRYEKKWFSVIDNKERDYTGELSPDGKYYVSRSRKNEVAVLNARTLDSLSLLTMLKGDSYFGTFSKSGKHYYFSDGKDQLCCIELPNGNLRWTLPIWEPISMAAGENYAVIQSTSLYVIDVKKGIVACEFDVDMTQKLKISLSPDEKWFIAGDKLYSIQYNQLMATGIDENYTALEKDYLIYRTKLMKLPNLGNLFE